MPIATSAMRATIAPACSSKSRIRAGGHQHSPDTALPNLDRNNSHFCSRKIDMNNGLPNESHQDMSPETLAKLEAAAPHCCDEPEPASPSHAWSTPENTARRGFATTLAKPVTRHKQQDDCAVYLLTRPRDILGPAAETRAGTPSPAGAKRSRISTLKAAAMSCSMVKVGLAWPDSMRLM